MSQLRPELLGGLGGAAPGAAGGSASAASTGGSQEQLRKYVYWGMVIGVLYFFGPGSSIFVYGFYGLLFFLGMLYLQQDSMLYACNHAAIPKRPQDNPPSMRSPEERNMTFTSETITTEDGCKIHAWMIKVPEGSDKVPTIIYFHGNAGNLGLRLPLYDELHHRLGVNILAFDYRGYGNSTGKPDEPGLQKDAVAVLKFLRDREDIDSSKIVLFGRSLGGAVAVWLAAQDVAKEIGLRGVIIENTFMSIADLAIRLFGLLRVFSFLLPVMLKSKWLTKEYIKRVDAPIMLLHGMLDQLIPHKHMTAIFDNAPNHRLTRIHRFALGGHNDTPLKETDNYYQAFTRFMSDLDLTMPPIPRKSSSTK